MPTDALVDDDEGDDVTASAADLRERDEEKKRGANATAFADRPKENVNAVDTARREESDSIFAKKLIIYNSKGLPHVHSVSGFTNGTSREIMPAPRLSLRSQAAAGFHFSAFAGCDCILALL